MITYIQLNYSDKSKGFPVEVAGVFNDGMNQHPIVLPREGTVICEAETINAGDNMVKLMFGGKIPNDVVAR